LEISELKSKMLDIETQLSLKKPRKSMRSSFDMEAQGHRDWQVTVHDKSREDRVMLLHSLDQIFLFSNLQQQQREQLVDAFAPVSVRKGDSIIVEGDDKNVQHLYILTQGSCRVTKQSRGVEEVVHTCRELECFGELALMYNCPRAATVTAATDAKLFSLGKKFSKVL
jgi:CRP-like cAMP-binding protein